MSAKKKKSKPAPLRITYGTCSGSGWLWSGVGHFGEQDGGHKDCGAQCPACLGMGYLEAAAFAAYATDRQRQADWLRANAKPNFETES